jgi:hypothetical protein
MIGSIPPVRALHRRSKDFPTAQLGQIRCLLSLSSLFCLPATQGRPLWFASNSAFSSTHPPQSPTLYIHIHSLHSFPPIYIYGVHRALLGPPGRRRLCPLRARAVRLRAYVAPWPPGAPIGPSLHSLCSHSSSPLCDMHGRNRRKLLRNLNIVAIAN